MQILRPDPIHPVRKRLWQAAGALALVMMVLVTREAIVRNLGGSHQLSLGEDFLPVYAAGRLVREGRASELYAMEPIAAIERAAVARADLQPMPMYGPFLNPPFFAALYGPFAALPYRSALCVWLAINLLLVAGSAALLCRMMPPNAGPAGWRLIPLLLVLPLPFWEAMCYQQNTFLSLFILCGITTVWRLNRDGSARRSLPPLPSVGADPRVRPLPSNGEGRHRGVPLQFPLTPALSRKERGKNAIRPARDILCGCLAGLLFYKPQLALAVAVVLVLTRGWRVALGLAVTGSLLLILTLRQMPGALGNYLHALGPMTHWIQTQAALPYKWERQVTPQSFWRLMLQGHETGETHALPKMLAAATALAFAGALAMAVLRCLRRRSDDLRSLDRLIAATITSMPLIMPYYMDYDLTLLAVPAVLLAAEWVRTPATIMGAGRWLFAAWVALFVEFYANPGLGSNTRFNLAVPLIGLVAGLSIVRCLRWDVATGTVDRYDAPELSAAA